MQLQNDKIVLIESTLIHDEKAFKAFREFFRGLNRDEVQQFDEFDYNLEENEIVHSHRKPLQAMYFDAFYPAIVREKVQNGYLVLLLSVLEKIY